MTRNSYCVMHVHVFVNLKRNTSFFQIGPSSRFFALNYPRSNTPRAIPLCWCTLSSRYSRIFEYHLRFCALESIDLHRKSRELMYISHSFVHWTTCFLKDSSTITQKSDCLLSLHIPYQLQCFIKWRITICKLKTSLTVL